METIANAATTVATTVSKTIWGEPNTTQGNETAGTEPISGVEGKGTIDEPYDQGNSENPTSTSGTGTATTSQPKLSPDNPISASHFNTDTTSKSENTPSSETTPAPKSGTISNIGPNTNNAAAGGAQDPLHSTDKTGVTGSMGLDPHGSDVIPSESSHPGVAPTSGAQPSQNQQGADRPRDAPSSEEASAIKSKKDEAEDALKKRDPNDHSGEPMKMHNGSEIPKTQEERRESKIGLPGGQEHGKEPKGTGEEWVKTSGLAAEGGDFDATKPGAGKEATRLVEEKGAKKSSPGQPAEHPPATTATSSPSSDKEKASLSEKIKTKLHIGHKNK